MLFTKVKDLKKRNFFFKAEKAKKINKFLFINFFSNNKKTIQLLKVKNRTKLSSKIKLKNRCVYTNRNKGVSKFFSLSRISQKDFMQFGLVPGYIKSVW